MKEKRKNSKTSWVFSWKDFNLFIKQCYRIVWCVEKIKKVKIQKL